MVSLGDLESFNLVTRSGDQDQKIMLLFFLDVDEKSSAVQCLCTGLSCDWRASGTTCE